MNVSRGRTVPIYFIYFWFVFLKRKILESWKKALQSLNQGPLRYRIWRIE